MASNEVFTLVVEVGRKEDDGLPKGAVGASLLCYATGRDEAEAVRETVAVLKTAGLAPLEVESYGTMSDRAEIEPEERAMMERARTDNAVVVAQMTPITKEDG